MNREIKFRAWDIKEKLMYPRVYPCETAYNGGTWNCYKDRWNHFKKNNEVEVMQYIGYSDLNIKDIYVGDVLSYDNNKNDILRIVQWRSDTLAFEFRSLKDNKYRDACGGFLNTVKIIGNIYENPELLGLK